MAKWMVFGPWLRWSRFWEHALFLKVVVDHDEVVVRIIVFRLMFTVGAERVGRFDGTD